MDVQTGLVCLGIVVISAVIIIIIFGLFGTKEKSYEEAIAEQRKLSDFLLLSKKDKNKEKKHKNKAGKKVKEKKEEKDDKDDKEEKTEHVQFEDVPQILPPEPPVQESNKGNKKKGKLEKIKPILVNKDEPLVIVTELSCSQPPLAEANHFDVIHPKDDFELVRSQSKENLQQMSQSDSVINKSPKETPTKSKKNNKDSSKDKKKDENTKDEKQDNTHTNVSSICKETVKEVKEQQKETPVKEVKEINKEIVPQQLSSKEPRKMKKKNDILSQIDGDAVNVELLMMCIQKAELSRSEIQMLTNQLLNKQQDNPPEHSEWTEGRADPVIKLKKQLAEKEKSLADEHEASVALQNKLKELRVEFNSEKSRFSANIRQLEDSLNTKVTETQTLHTRMQHILESHAAEKQGFARQIEQLQTKVNEDSAIIHKLQEDQGQTQGHLQQELMAQRKQMEVQFAQMRENENALKTQLTQKHVEVQELQNELQATCESSTAEIEILRQQLGIMQGQLMHSEGQLQHFKDADDRLQDVARQLEESHHTHADLDHRLKNAHRHEQELQKQVNSLQAELNLVKSEANEASTLKAELCKVQTELIKVKSELSVSMNEAKSEAAEITILKTALNNKEDEWKKSQDEIVAVQNELQQANAQIVHVESKLSSVQKELELVKIEFDKTDRNLKEAKNDANQRQNETQKMQDTLTSMQTKLAKAQAQIRDSNEVATELKALQTEIDRLKNIEMKAENTELQITKLHDENNRLHSELVNAMEMQKQLQQQCEQQKIIIDTTESTRTALSAEEETLFEILKIELTDKNKELNSLNEQLHILNTNANEYQHCIKILQEDLDAQRSKNNELRIKNWKAMEALTMAEARNTIFSNGKNIEEEKQKIKIEQEEITKAFLQRIFPDIKVSETSYEQWLLAFETEIYANQNKLKEENNKISLELEKQNENLQGMVSHYKQIIEDTEDLLNTLQQRTESEETRWKLQLQQKEEEVTSLRIELNDMQTKLTIHTQEVREQEPMQNVKELDHLEPNCKSTEKMMFEVLNNKDLVTLEQLQEEKDQLSQELQVECSKRATLDAEVTKLRSLVETSEASLTHEKNLVTQLQQEVSQLKSEIYGGCSSSEQSMLNGPSTSDSLQSEFPSTSQALITTVKSTHLKNTEFTNMKPVNLISEFKITEEIESPLTTKCSCQCSRSNMTDPNAQQHNKKNVVWRGQLPKQKKKKKKVKRK